MYHIFSFLSDSNGLFDLYHQSLVLIYLFCNEFSVFLHQTLFYGPSETKNTKNDFSDFALTRHSFGTKKIEMFDGINERSFDKTKKHKNTKHGLPPKF